MLENKKMSDRLVDAQWLSTHLQDPKVRVIEVDLTGTDAYAAGHIPGALGWNWKEWLWDPLEREFPTPQEFARRCGEAGIANDTTVVFYGEPVPFGTYAWWVFTYLGHADVRLLDGGRTAWVAKGNPLTTEVPRIVPRSYLPPCAPKLEMRVGRDEVLRDLPKYRAADSMVLLDHRSPEEFDGRRVNVPGMPDVGAERNGHIPGARHLYFTEFLNADTSFKPPAELRSLLEARGADAGKEIVSYCRLSHRATLAYFVMHELLGFKKVRSYDGSWTEWGSMVGMPVER